MQRNLFLIMPLLQEERQFVDADHAGNKVTRRLHTGFIIFMNMATVYWYSKGQNCVETSTYLSEMVALRIISEKIINLGYKLSVRIKSTSR